MRMSQELGEREGALRSWGRREGKGSGQPFCLARPAVLSAVPSPSLSQCLVPHYPHVWIPHTLKSASLISHISLRHITCAHGSQAFCLQADLCSEPVLQVFTVCSNNALPVTASQRKPALSPPSYYRTILATVVSWASQYKYKTILSPSLSTGGETVLP